MVAPTETDRPSCPGKGNEEAIRCLRAALAALIPCRHSVDFRSVAWHGDRHSFTSLQAKVIRQLWAAWEDDVPEVGADTLLTEVDPDRESGRLVDVFRGHAAWGTMIIPGETKGAYRLADSTN